MTNFDSLKNQVAKNIATAKLLGYFYLSLPNYPRDAPLSQIDLLIGIFSRYTLRAMYFADNFIENVNKTIKDEKAKQVGKEIPERYVAVIADASYFDFDAFVFSCKSILEANTLERAKHLNDNIRPEFERFSKHVLENFIRKFLNVIRNEITHLNNHGSSIGSMMIVEKGEYKLVAFNYEDDTELVKVFSTILNEMSTIIHHLSSLIIKNEFDIWGNPITNYEFTYNKITVKLSDFVIWK